MGMVDINNGEKMDEKLAYYRALFDNMRNFVDIIWEIDISKYSVYLVHDRITASLENRELSMDEMISHVTGLCHPKYIDAVNEHLTEDYLRNIKETETIEIKSIVDGSYHNIKVCFTPVMDSYGETEKVFVTSQDIQRNIEKYEVKDSKQERLDRYLTSLSCGILQYKRDTKEIVYANDMALKILGYSSIEEMQMEGFDGVVKNVYTEDSDKIKKSIENLKSEDQIIECEYRVKHSDGSELYCIGKVRLINQQGEEPIIQRSMIDVTSMKRVNLLYKQTADTLSVANMGLWYFILDDGAPRFYVDEVVGRLVGVSAKHSTPEEAFNVWYNTLRTADKEKVDAAVEKMRAGIPAEVTYPYNHPTRGTIIVRCGGIIDKSYDGNGILIRGYHQDITEYNEKLIEQIEVADVVNKHFECVGIIDFKKKTCKVTADATGQFTKSVDVARQIEPMVARFSELISDSSKEDYEKLADLDYVASKLKDGNAYSAELEFDTEGRFCLDYVPSSFDDDGEVERCVFFAERA